MEKDIAFALFVNTVSGSKVGTDYLTLASEEVTFKNKKGPTIHIFIFDLFDVVSRKRGLQVVKDNQDLHDMRVIICGGDGTVLWVVQEVVDAGISIDNITFGIIPIGTGNDFSRSLGWGSSSVGFSDKNIIGLKEIVQQWVHSEIRKYDIWDFEMELYEDGNIMRVKDKKEIILESKSLKRSFSNYFGVGIDARIGYSFDKHRTRNVFTNLICYACIGLFKIFKKSNKVDELIENMEYQQLDNIVGDTERMSETEQKPQKQLVFHTNKQNYGEHRQLKKGFRNILCMNSTSFMAGATKVWTTGKSALQDSAHIIDRFHKQDFSDGELQFVNFKSQIHLGLEKLISGRSSKLAQGPGPFLINFKHPQTIIETYLQIDGQYFKVQNPKSIKVEKAKFIPGSQINVMFKRK